MLQILIFFYAPGLLFGWHGLERFTTIIVAFSINYACYFSEIYRSVFQSVPRGQYEAGQVLVLPNAMISPNGSAMISVRKKIRHVMPNPSNSVTVTFHKYCFGSCGERR